MQYIATLYRQDADGNWIAIRNEIADRRIDAIETVTTRVNMGYGGHGRSERAIAALRNGAEISTPLGTYKVETEIDPIDDAELRADRRLP